MPRKVSHLNLYVRLALLVAAASLPGCALTGLAPGNADSPNLPNETPAPSPEPTLGPEELLQAAVDAGNAGEWAQALRMLDHLLAIVPEQANAYLQRGHAQRALGELIAAEADYTTALTLDSGLAAAYYGRALVYVAQGQSEAALIDFAQAIAVEPSFALAYKERAALQRAAGNYAAARLDLEVYLSLVPETPERVAIEAQMAELQSLLESEVAEGSLLFADDFSDVSSGWYSNGSESAQMEYADGGYRITVNAVASGAWAYSGQVFANARLEVQAQKQAGSDESNWFGLLCRVQADAGEPSFYAFIISSDGYYGIGKRVGATGLQLLNAGEMQFSNAVIQGEATNLVAAECVGNRLTLYVNGVKVAEVEDGDLGNGQAALIVGTFEEAGASVLFDNFAAYAAQP